MKLPFWAWWRNYRTAPTVSAGDWLGWMRVLAAVRERLAELNQLTEQDFLNVGQKLQRFLEAARGISEACSALVVFLSGAEVRRGADDLRSILRRAQAVTAQASDIRQALDKMLVGVAGVAHPLEELSGDMRTFRVMSTLIRIESARLNQEGVEFASLAEDVQKLAADIEENGGTILSASRRLDATVRGAIAEIKGFEMRQAAQLPRIMAQSEASLATLHAGRGHASRASRDMAARYDAIWREIGELVTSLQFHDITRQQVEHVAEALARADQEIGDGSAPVLARLCELQHAQLGRSKEAFLAAVARIRSSLEQLAQHVAGMAAGGTDLLGNAAGKEQTFLEEMETDFATIRTALGENAESRSGMSKVAKTVSSSVKEMSGVVEKIEAIGIRMQRIALNANIKAIRIGATGIALGAVAEGIQTMAAHASRQTVAVAERIREIAEGSANLSGVLAGSGEDLLAEVERIIIVFHSADRENRRRMAEIEGLGKSLAEELAELSGSIRADRILAEAVDDSITRIEQVMAAARLLPDAESSVGDELMRKLEQRYTMQSERAVHREKKQEGIQVGTNEPVAALGDNVELF